MFHILLLHNNPPFQPHWPCSSLSHPKFMLACFCPPTKNTLPHPPSGCLQVPNASSFEKPSLLPKVMSLTPSCFTILVLLTMSVPFPLGGKELSHLTSLGLSVLTFKALGAALYPKALLW